MDEDRRQKADRRSLLPRATTGRRQTDQPSPIRPKPIPCPACHSLRSRVTDARDAPRTVREQLAWTGNGYWRRRRCEDCGRTFTTEETVSGLDADPHPHPPTDNI